MPSTQPFGERLADLRAHAEEVGRPVPSVTLHAVRPEAGTEIQLRDAQLVIAREHGMDG